MVLVDTNILLHAINTDSQDHARCAAAVEALVNGSENWMLSWAIAYEFMRVSTHPRVFPNPLTLAQAHAYLEEWMSSEACTVIAESDHHLRVLGESRQDVGRLTGNIIHDFHHAVLMREHGIKQILSLDRDFRTFPWIEMRPLPNSEDSTRTSLRPT